MKLNLAAAGMLLILASCGKDESADGRTSGALMEPAGKWTVEPAGWKVTVDRPAGWKERKLPDGRPVIFVAGVRSQAAEWSVDVRTGIAGRTVAQLVEQFSGGIDAAGGKVIEKRVEKRPDGKDAGIVLHTVPGSSTEIVREYFYFLNDDSMLAVMELQFGKEGEAQRETLAKITRSAQAFPAR